MDLTPNPIYYFVVSWGVIHHLQEPRKAFSKVASQVKKRMEYWAGCYIIYQKIYEEGQKIRPKLSSDQKLDYCKKKVQVTEVQYMTGLMHIIRHILVYWINNYI